MAPPFSQRLQQVMRSGDLSVADLSLWLESAYASVRMWTLGKWEPRGYRRNYLSRSLSRLEALIRTGRLPELARYSLSARGEILRELRDASVPKARASNRGLVLWDGIPRKAGHK
jgi:hypothetical protein